MRKEVIFALILGSLLGGIILYGIKLANDAASLPDQEIITENKTTSPSPTPKAIEPGLTITTPENHAVVFESTLSLIGNSSPNSTIVIVSDADEKIIDTDSNGKFDTTLKLIGGENNILISSFSSDTLIASASIQIIYTTTVIE